MSDAVKGLRELEEKLKRLETATAVKALRSAALASTLPTVKEMKAAAPKGKGTHRTYKGRLVAPGFLSRSVKRVTRHRDGVLSVSIGVKAEAFYGVTFLDRGTKHIPAKKWFVSRFESNANSIVSLFKAKLADRIKKAAQ